MPETVNVLFRLPEEIRRGLTEGTLKRKGGLILRTEDNRVRAWLRETGDVAQTTGTQVADGGQILAMLQAQVVDLSSQAALHKKLDHIAEVAETNLRATLRIEGQVDELRREQLTQLADPVLVALDHIEAAATAADSDALEAAATVGLATGRKKIIRWLGARSGEQLVADLSLVRRLTHALLLCTGLEIGRMDQKGAERVLDQVTQALDDVYALIRAVRPSSRLPSARELAGMKGRKEFLEELELARWTVSSAELRTLGAQTPVRLIDVDGVDRGLLVVVEETEAVHVPR